MMKTTAILFAALMLTGCATTTTPTPASSAKQAPASRLLAFQAKPNGQYGKIVVTRDSGLLGSGCMNAVSINGQMAARLEPGETSSFLVPAGEVILQSGQDPMGKGLCTQLFDSPTIRESSIREGETKHFRMLISRDGRTDIQRTGI